MKMAQNLNPILPGREPKAPTAKELRRANYFHRLFTAAKSDGRLYRPTLLMREVKGELRRKHYSMTVRNLALMISKWLVEPSPSVLVRVNRPGTARASTERAYHFCHFAISHEITLKKAHSKMKESSAVGLMSYSTVRAQVPPSLLRKLKHIARLREKINRLKDSIIQEVSA